MEGERAEREREMEAGRVLCAEVRECVSASGQSPRLVLLLAQGEPLALAFSQHTEIAAAAAGISLSIRHVSEGGDALKAQIVALNADPDVDGIILQLPFPSELGDATEMLRHIAPSKDMDGLGSVSVARYIREARSAFAGRPLPLSSSITPAIFKACEEVLFFYGLLPAPNFASRPCIVLMGLPAPVEAALVRCLAVAGCRVWTEASGSSAEEVGRQSALGRIASADAIVIGSRQPAIVCAQWVRSGAVLIDVGASTSCAPPRSFVGATSTPPTLGQGSVARNVHCVSCHDGLAAHIAAVRMHNVCNAALIRRGFVEMRDDVSPAPTLLALQNEAKHAPDAVRAEAVGRIDVLG